MIIDGLPPGTTLELDPSLERFACLLPLCGEPGGTLGGEHEVSAAALVLEVRGTGDLTGFERNLTLPVFMETQSGPRTFPLVDREIVLLQGSLSGDPDFLQLTVTAGLGEGLPGPGHTDITVLGGGTFVIDSFFDVTYRVDFVGAPGSALEGLSGSTTGALRLTGYGASLALDPVAGAAAAPLSTVCGVDIAFDGFGSRHGHPYRTLTSWEWDFDYDGASFQADASGVTAIHGYASPGSRTVALRVGDDYVLPRSDIDTVTVEQLNRPPSADAGGPYVLREGFDLPLDGGGSSDPDAPCGDAVAAYDWDLDDDGQFDDAAGAQPTVPWADVLAVTCSGGCAPGHPYAVGLRVTDGHGAADTAATTLTVTGSVGSNDDVVDFGSGQGLWVNYNDDPASWEQVHPGDPELVGIADLDGAYGHEVLVDFGGGGGVWVNYNDDPASWGLIHPSSPEAMAVGDLDGSGRDDVVLDFGPAGVWVNYDDDPALWRQVHTLPCEAMATGNVDGN